MKFLTLFILITCASSAISQVSVAVGDSSIVYQYKKSEMYTCSAYGDTCYYITFGASQIEPPFYNSPYSGGISFEPTVSGEFIDTCIVGSGWVYNKPPLCNWTPCYNSREHTNDTVIVRGTAYYDNRIKFRIATDLPNLQLYFEPDSSGLIYEKARLTATIFNNRSDGVVFKDWGVTPNNNFQISLQESGNSDVDSILVEGNSFLYITMQFSTNILPQLKQQSFNRQITLPCKGSGVDTSFFSNIEFILKRKSLFKEENKDVFQLAVFPNPGSTTTVTCYVPLFEDGHVSLNIFDILGNKVINLWDGKMKKGESSFPVDLPIGLYFVRMTTSQGVKILNLVSSQ